VHEQREEETKMTKHLEQVKTEKVKIEDVMRTAAFRRGVSDYRHGRKHFDEENERDPGDWHYERGRQFAVLAPCDMQVVSQRTQELNPEAVKFFKQHSSDIL
jgi:hypothetical protein